MKPLPTFFIPAAPWLSALALAGCVTTAPQPRTPAPVAPAVQPAMLTPALKQREPDTCKSAALQGLVGQPSGNLRTVVVPGPVRLIGPRTVYDQEEYRSDRINAFLDGDGIIQRLSCG